MNNIKAGPFNVSEHPKFGAVLADKSFDELYNAGFSLGDSVDITFSNGVVIKDVPFYDAFNVKAHEPIICHHPGYEKIFVTFNDGPAMYKKLKLTENDTISFSLNTKAKYLNIHNAMKIFYSRNRRDYLNDIVFSNFRPLNYGKLKRNLFYRSSSPFDKVENRVDIVNSFLQEFQINYIYDLADDKSDLDSFYSKSNENLYWKKLYDNNSVMALSMSSAIASLDYKKNCVEILRSVMQNKGPYLINCTLGKDRTGYVSMLIEALAFATKDELERDYMLSFINLHQLDPNDIAKYNLIRDLKLSNYICYLANVDTLNDLTDEKLHTGAINYLLDGGMSKDEISVLLKYICQ